MGFNSGFKGLIWHRVSVTVRKWPSSVQTCTLDDHLHRVTHTGCHINTTDSPDDDHRGAQNMYRIGINIYEKRTVHQVGYLQELNRDARWTKHKIRIAPFIPVITPAVCLHKLLFSMEPQPISGIDRLITEIPRSHTTGHTHTHTR